MVSPPQQKLSVGVVAGQQEQVFQLKLAGWSYQRIADHVGISVGTVSNRLKAAIADHVGPLAEEYVDTREAELSDLYAKAYRLAIDTKRDDDVRLRAINTCAKLNESRRKLRGADAPQALTVSLDRRSDAESAVVAEVLVMVIPAVAEAAGVDQGRRAQLERYGLELAQWALTGRQGDRPECPAQRLAITAGTRGAESRSDGPSPAGGPPVPWTPGGDAAGGVLAALDAFEREFCPLDGDDDDE